MRNRRQSVPNSVTAIVETSRTTALIAMFCCCSAAQMRAQGTSASTEVDRVRGVVINSVTREPVGRALVYSPDNTFATMTDDRGRFEFVFPRPEPEPVAPPTNGQLDSAISIVTRFPATNVTRPGALVARKTGYLPADEGVDISQFAPRHQDVTIKLVPEARIIGHVVIPGWDGAQRMQLQVFRRAVREGREFWDGVGNAATRADGEFRFAGLSSGSYKLLTGEQLDRDPLTFRPGGPLLGYPPLYYPGASDFESAALIHLTDGETFQTTLTPVRKPYYPVKIGITNASSGQQVAVMVFPQGRPGPGFSLGYDQQEGEIQGSLPDGTYTLLVTSYGPSMLTGISNITVQGSALSGASIGLLPASSVVVNVREEFQHPVINPPDHTLSNLAPAYNPRRPNYLQVTLIPDEPFSLASQVTLSPPRNPEDESLIIENVLPGRYRVSASSSGMGYVAAITSGGRDRLREPLVVGAGASIPPLEIVMRDDGGQVNGTIESDKSSARSGEQTPSNHVVVYLRSLDRIGDQPLLTILDSSGAFSFPQIPPGSYRLFAIDRQTAEFDPHNDEMLKRYESKIQVIRVVAEQKLNLRVPLIMTSE